jgi:D-aspartate ligase
MLLGRKNGSLREPVGARRSRATPARPDVLLTMAEYGGTLAAARSLGRQGVRVIMADNHRFAPAVWSRYVAQTVRCPVVEDSPHPFIEWLLDYGARHPGTVLYATSDDIAWLIARYRDALARDFCLYVPPFDAVYALLNKWHLYRACSEVGIDAPETWSPHGEEDVGEVADHARFPVVVKPQTQAFLHWHQKGRVVRDAQALAAAYAEFSSIASYSAELRGGDPWVDAPLVQSFVESAVDSIYNLSGFIDETGDRFVVAASRKVLQWPRRLGIGLCFEEAEVRPELADAVAKLCRHLGYYGTFEIEFVESEGRTMLIDFNPRFYGELQFDIARGLDLPRLVYLAAAGERDALSAAIAEVGEEIRHPSHLVYANRIDLEISLRLRQLAGSLTHEEETRWRDWLSQNRGRVTDSTLDRDDWLPGIIQGASALLRRLAHLRSAWRAAHEA